MSGEYNDISKLFAAASEIEIQAKYEAINFFSVSGYPHYENVASNVLAFFFDCKQEHNFKDLWLKSLIDCYNKKMDQSITLEVSRNIEISREEYTADGRIDLFIECDDKIIVVENKIYSGVGNPLESYHRYAIERARGNNAQVIEILLSLRKEENRYDEKDGYNFINITYHELLSQVKKNKANYIKDESNKWVIYMNEFCDNIRCLQEDSMQEINTKWQEFLSGHNEEIKSFFEKFNTDIELKRENFKRIVGNLKKKAESGKFEISIGNIGYYNGKPHFSIYMNCKNEKESLALEVYSIVDPRQKKGDLEKYYVAIWNRDNKKWRSTELYGTLKKQLEVKKDWICKDDENDDWGEVLIVHEKNWSEFNQEELEEGMIDIYSVICNVLKG